MKAAVAPLVVLLVACSFGTGSTTPSPRPAASAAASPAASPAPSPAASPAASPVASPPGGPAVATSFVCTEPVPEGDRLVLATLAGSDLTILRDVQDLAHARTICTLNQHGGPALFVNGHTIAYIHLGRLVREDVSAGTAAEVATPSAGAVTVGNFASSVDGSTFTYTESGSSSVNWRIVTSAGNRLLATLPPVPGRGIDPDNDDLQTGFSADGHYVALETTFSTGGGGDTAPLQIRRVDGTLVYSRAHGTMGVWAGNVYYFRDGAQLYRWGSDGLTPLTLTPAGAFGPWIRPRVSPDGNLIAFAWRDSGFTPHVAVLNLARGVTTPEGPGGRNSPAFANQNNLWYAGEGACSDCMGGFGPTGKSYLFDIAGQAEATSRITQLFDGWPKTN